MITNKLEETNINKQGANQNNVVVIIKTTYRCNQNCLYCYEELLRKSNNGIKMDDITLLNLTRKILEHCQTNNIHSVLFIWHGGEPLLMGLDFYKRAINYQRKYKKDVVVKNGMQTNGTLMTEEMGTFFSNQNFGIGFSLDGPEKIHEYNRPSGNGVNTYNKIVSSIKMYNHALSKKSNPGILSVMTKTTTDHIDELYDFLYLNNFDCKINPVIIDGGAKRWKDQLAITPEEYGEAMIYLFDRWFFEKGTTFSIDTLEDIIISLLTRRPKGCLFEDSCFTKFLHIDPPGNIHPCGFNDFILGNINKDSISDVLHSPIISKLNIRKERVPAICTKCDYYDICHSGCPRNALMRRGRIYDRDFYCDSYRMLFEHINNALRRELNTSSFEKSCTGVALEDIENDTLRFAITKNKILETSQWMDENWKQWRREHSVWTGNYKEYRDWYCQGID